LRFEQILIIRWVKISILNISQLIETIISAYINLNHINQVPLACRNRGLLLTDFDSLLTSPSSVIATEWLLPHAIFIMRFILTLPSGVRSCTRVGILITCRLFFLFTHCASWPRLLKPQEYTFRRQCYYSLQRLANASLNFVISGNYSKLLYALIKNTKEEK